MTKKYRPYILSTAIYTLVAFILALVFQFMPFGNETMLTVDLGQQYIDFYSLFKETIFKSPEMILYSFQKAIGGEMMGLWSYYLLSPFNLILLFFNESNFHYGVSLLIFLKILAINLALMVFVKKKYLVDDHFAIILGLSYSLMSYVIANMLNIMWLDGVMMLPIVALALSKLFGNNQHLFYIVSLALTLMMNYYIGYMICIFLAFYAVFLLIEDESITKFKSFCLKYVIFIRDSIIAALLAGFVLIPTLFSLLKSKGEYFNNEFNWDGKYSPLDILAKMFIGAFNFEEMKSGSPNIYLGILVSILCMGFFIHAGIRLKEKIVALGVFVFYYLSFHFDILNRLWHGGQFPIWYHYRFSFTLAFFCIVLACKFWMANKANQKFYRFILIFAVCLAFTSYIYFNLDNYPYLSEIKLALTLIFCLVYLIFIFFYQHNKFIMSYGFIIILTIELFTNAAYIISEMSYVDKTKFEDYTQLMTQAITGLQHGDQNFYRINKTFMRTKNEAMYYHYNSLNHFGSTMEAHMIEFYSLLGLPSGSGFVAYTNGTLFLDDFFNIRYLIDKTTNNHQYLGDNYYHLYQESTNFDYQYYPIIDQRDRYIIRENEDRFGLAMEMSPSLKDTILIENQPIENQNTLLNLINYDQEHVDYFKKKEIQFGEMDGISIKEKINDSYFEFKLDDKKVPGTYQLNFQMNSNNPYYFTLPSQFDSQDVDLKLNGQNYRIYTPYKTRQVANAGYLSNQLNHQLEVKISKDGFKSNLVQLYEFDLQKYHQLLSTKLSDKFNIETFKHNHIVGNIHIKQKEANLLFTIPYDKGWQVKVDGQIVPTMAVLNDSLLAIPIGQGQHKIDLLYQPNYIYFGIISSVIGILLVSLIQIQQKNKNSIHKME